MSASNERTPNEAEQEFFISATKIIKGYRDTNSDAGLVEVFGPDAAEPCQFGLIPQPHWSHCPPFKARVGDLLAMLCTPLEASKNELPLFVPAVISAKTWLKRRQKQNVTGLHFATLDFDRGDASLPALAAKMDALGIFGVAYRSPSDGKTTTDILRCKGTPDAMQGRECCAPTLETVTAWFAMQGFRADILGALEIVNPCKIERQTYRFKIAGRWESREVARTKIDVRHNPISKSRIVVPLKRPFERRPNEGHEAFNRRWSEVLGALEHALGFAADPTCRDVSRAFFFPSANPPSGAADIVHVVPGAALDLESVRMKEWRSAAAVQLVERERATTERRLQRLERPHIKQATNRRYRFADLIRDCCANQVRSEKGDHFIVAECPFDELHSNSGDPADRAFWCTNSGSCGCHHGHGEEHQSADYAAKMLEDGWITAEQLAMYTIPTMSELNSKYREQTAKAYAKREDVS